MKSHHIILYALTLASISVLLTNDSHAHPNVQQHVLLYTIEPPRPPAERFSDPTTLDIGPDGTLYVLDNDNHRVQYFDGDGNYKGTIGSLGRQDGRFLSLDGLSVGVDGSIYVADHFSFGEGWPVQRLQRFNKDGQFLERVKNPVKPIAMGLDGAMYSFEYGTGHLVKYSINGELINSWGRYGKNNGEFGLDGHIDIDVSKDGTVIVGDSSNNRIQHFTADGTYIGKWGEPGHGDGQFSGNLAISVGIDDAIYVLEVRDNSSVSSRIQKFSNSGQFIEVVDHTQGIFDLIVDISVSQNGTLYALVTAQGEIWQYNPSGVISNRIGSTHVSQNEVVRGISEIAGEGFIVNNGSHAVFFRPYGDSYKAIDLSEVIDDNGEYTYFPGSFAITSEGTLYTIVAKRRFTTPDESILDLDIVAFRSDNGEMVSRWRFDSIIEPGLDQVRAVSSLALGEDQYLYIANIYRNQIQKYTLDGKLEKHWPLSEADSMGLNSEVTIDVNTLGEVYTLQYWWSETESKTPPFPTVRKFNADGALITSWEFDEEVVLEQKNESQNYYTMSVGLDNRIYIGARHRFSNGEVQVYTDNGKLIEKWGRQGYGPYENTRVDMLMFYPIAIETLQDGRIIVADALPGYDHMRLRVFGYNGDQRWKISYYKDRTFSEWPVETVLYNGNSLSMDWGNSSPVGEVTSDGFAARIYRNTRLGSGTYTFHVQAAGGVRVWVGNNMLVDRWNSNQCNVDIQLKVVAGDYPVEVEFTDRGGDASLEIAWTQERQEIILLPLVKSYR